MGHKVVRVQLKTHLHAHTPLAAVVSTQDQPVTLLGGLQNSPTAAAVSASPLASGRIALYPKQGLTSPPPGSFPSLIPALKPQVVFILSQCSVSADAEGQGFGSEETSPSLGKDLCMGMGYILILGETDKVPLDA